jgi:hypothetical protein
MLKTVKVPGTRRVVKFGRRRPRFPAARLKASSFLNLKGIVVPATTNYRAQASASLRNIYGNDQLGDCVPAGLNHVAGLANANAGSTFVPTLANVIADYSAIGGYVPGDESTDNGCDEDTALAYYQSHGWANGTKAAGSISIDPTNDAEVRACLYLFENVIFGVGLPDAWISPFPSADGFVWDVAGDADQSNGHCFVAVDLASVGLVIDTWAMYGTITPKAVAKYASAGQGGQLFCLLTPDQVSKAMAKAPNGMDWPSLIAAFDAQGGNVAPIVTPPAPSPAPAPSPTPTPAPTPAPVVLSLAGAQAAVGAELQKGPRIYNRSTAAEVADKALAAYWKTAGKR